jgi:hypothetical protein
VVYCANSLAHDFLCYLSLSPPPLAGTKEGEGLFDSDMPESVRLSRDSKLGTAIKHQSEYHR